MLYQNVYSKNKKSYELSQIIIYIFNNKLIT